MTRVILDRVKSVRNAIEILGKEHHNTLELVGYFLSVYLILREHNYYIDLDQEMESIKAYYGSETFNRRYEDEKDHYEQLKYSLIHKIKEVKYFFGQGPENRKIVVFSNDCISMIQYLKRGRGTRLHVYMRSSDVDSLLPMDLLYLCKILRAINERFFPNEQLDEQVDVWIGSAHIYTSGGRP